MTLIQFADRLSSAATALILILKALRRKNAMSDTPQAVATAQAPAAVAQADAPMVSAGGDKAAPAAAGVNANAVVNSVIQTVQAHPEVPAAAAPSVIASILAGLYQAEPAIFAVSRASSKTQTEVGLGLGLAQLILGAFLH